VPKKQLGSSPSRQGSVQLNRIMLLVFIFLSGVAQGCSAHLRRANVLYRDLAGALDLFGRNKDSSPPLFIVLSLSYPETAGASSRKRKSFRHLPICRTDGAYWLGSVILAVTESAERFIEHRSPGAPARPQIRAQPRLRPGSDVIPGVFVSILEGKLRDP